jgi:hypothetical protein
MRILFICKLLILKILGHMKYILSVLISFIFSLGFTQNYFDIVNFTYTNTPQNDFEISDAKTNVEEIALELNFGLAISENTNILTGIFTNQTIVSLDSNTSPSKLNVLGLNIGLNTNFSSNWSGTFMTFTKIASDKIKFSNDNMQYALLSLFTNKKRDDLKFFYGLYANTEKYGAILVPLFGLYYVSNNKRLEANMKLPIIADINYKLRNKLWLGMKFDGLGTTYNLNDQNYSAKGAYVSKVSNEIVSYLRVQLNESLYLNGKIGYAISRNYEVYDTNDKIDLAIGPIYFGDHRTQLNERFKDGVIFKLELFYRLHFDE